MGKSWCSAPYRRYHLKLQLENIQTKQKYILALTEANNLKWIPGLIVGEHYDLEIVNSFPSGKYDIRIGLEDDSGGQTKMLKVPFKNSRKGEDGFYKMGEIFIE